MRRLLAAGALSLAAVAADAGEIPVRGLGVRVAALGDVDGDGKPDFATASRGAAARVCVVSGATGRALWTAAGNDAAPLPDQDGDGKPDVAVASGTDPSGAWVAICKGATGERVAAVSPKADASRLADDAGRFTGSVALLGDVDGDKRPDLLVTRVTAAKFRRGSGIAGLLQPWCESATAYVVGLDGKVIADLKPDVSTETRSPLASPAGDADGDGMPDVFVEVREEGQKLPLEVRSLAKGVLMTFKGDNVSPPDAVAPCGDVDGDKAGDFVFGRSSGMGRRFDTSGEVRVVSGKDGHVIRSMKGGREGDSLGQCVAALADVDGDGVPDLAAGEPGYEPKKSLSLAGAVVAWSGKTGKVLWTARGEAASGSLGTAMAAIGDLDGDGAADLAVGAPGFGPDDKGAVLVLSGRTGKTLVTFSGK